MSVAFFSFDRRKLEKLSRTHPTTSLYSHLDVARNNCKSKRNNKADTLNFADSNCN